VAAGLESAIATEVNPRQENKKMRADTPIEVRQVPINAHPRL